MSLTLLLGASMATTPLRATMPPYVPCHFPALVAAVEAAAVAYICCDLQLCSAVYCT